MWPTPGGEAYNQVWLVIMKLLYFSIDVRINIEFKMFGCIHQFPRTALIFFIHIF